MIKAILWDVDGTLLDFAAAEKTAVRNLFGEFGFGDISDETIGLYSQINKKYWERLETGELTKPQVLLGRFEEFFELIGIDKSKAVDFNNQYQVRLGDTVVFCDDSKAIVESLKGKVIQYVVSNGTVIAQNKKLRISGFDHLMDGIYLSEQIGHEKPSRDFFAPIMDELADIGENEIIIVGDSLTSDIRGGNNVGIRTCWYNPKGLVNDKGVIVDYEIADLHGIYDILSQEAMESV